MTDTHFVTDVDYNRPGRQLSRLQIPVSTNSAGWANEFLPIAVLNGAPGPTALLLGGNHGDEYEGQTALIKLAQSIDPEQLHGRLIMIPSLNRPAAQAGTRLSPLDGKNLNRCFPGSNSDTITGQIAHYVSSVLFPLADYVIDIHSGGRSIHFLPSVNMHNVPNADQMQQMVAAGMAWGVPYVFIYRDVGGVGLLPGMAESLGKVTLGTEIGSASQYGVEMVRYAEEGVQNVLRFAGILRDRPFTPSAEPAQLVAADEYDDYIMAPVSGIFEPFLEMGDAVAVGQQVGQIHSLETPFQPAAPVYARTAGMVMGRRSFPLTKQGECVIVVVRPVTL
jgi:predicted deacylase